MLDFETKCSFYTEGSIAIGHKFLIKKSSTKHRRVGKVFVYNGLTLWDAKNIGWLRKIRTHFSRISCTKKEARLTTKRFLLTLCQYVCFFVVNGFEDFYRTDFKPGRQYRNKRKHVDGLDFGVFSGYFKTQTILIYTFGKG